MGKSASTASSLPTVILEDTLLHLPGVTFNLNLSNHDALSLLSLLYNEGRSGGFLMTPNIQKSIDVLRTRLKSNTTERGNMVYHSLNKYTFDSMTKLNELFSPLESKQPYLCCLMADSVGKIIGSTGVVSRLVGIHIMPESCVLSLKGECRSRIIGDGGAGIPDTVIKQYTYINEVIYDIEFSNEVSESPELLEKSQQIIQGIKANLKLSQRFLDSYSALNKLDHQNEDDSFKQVLKKLNPLCELLFIQLSDENTTTNLDKLDKFIASVASKDIRRVLKICDIYVSVFPFSHIQVMNYLQAYESEARMNIIIEFIDFVKVLFSEYLNVDFVFASWQRLGRLNNGKSLQSKFILNHFNSLKELLDMTSRKLSSNGSNSSTKRDKAYSPSGVVPISSGVRRSNTDDDDNDLASIEKFISSLSSVKISEDAKKLLIKDFKRLQRMQSSSSEYHQLRNYMEIIMDLPWAPNPNPVHADAASKREISLDEARNILNEDHYGMGSVKERILEHLAILKLQSSASGSNSNKFDTKSPIMLLNGPPGVGKTSLAKSIARSIGCDFQRISLGGINDFADLKGHRRTYVGANPGLLIQALRKADSMENLVILLDEIDKIGMAGNKGNPEAALLEVLDPEQNVSFTDHYLGFSLDLSKITFIATSNNKWEITEPLLDRMETIDLDGYNYKEKIIIAEKFVLPRQCKRNGLKKGDVVINSKVLSKIVNSYTHEAGIRNFERLIGKICRKKAVEFLTSSKEFKYVNEVLENDLIKYLGVPSSFSDSEKFTAGDSRLQNDFGIVNGLSYNSNGSGSLLKFEMIGLPGSKGISCTGRLGEVLLESCEIAETLVDHLINSFKIMKYDDDKLLERLNDTSVHMHVPEGGISKDGPSAGITMTLCYLSLILKLPVPENIAMTGEITLSAKVLPIGGLKEKLLGASLTGKIDKVIIPRLNRKDLIDAYILSISDKEKFQLELTRLVLEEEKCLLSIGKSERYAFSDEVEKWVKSEYGIEVAYVDDFLDVIGEVWGDNIVLLRKEMKAHL